MGDEEVVETTSVETSTSFAPTVIPTVASETTTASPTTLRSFTTTTEVEISSTTSTGTTTTSTVTSTTTTTTTTTFESTERAVKYTTQDPFARLDSLRKKLKYGKTPSTTTVSVPSYQGDLLTAEDIDDTDSQSTEAPAFNFASPFRRFQRPKYGNEKDFGKRIKKKRPGYWVKKHTSDKIGLFGGSIEPTRRPYRTRGRLSSYTSTSTTESTTQGNDNKYGPYRATFEQIYKDAFNDDNVDTESDRRFKLPRRRNYIPRSTTPAPPFTVDAEVYEVHPKTRLRITTRSPATKGQEHHHPLTHTTAQVKTVEAEEADYYTYQDDYVYEPTTSESLKEVEESVTTTTPPLEYQEYVPTVKVYTEVTEEASTTTTVAAVTEEDVQEDVHETADKHSTTTLPTVTETTFVHDERENDVDIDRVDLDIENEISDQLVEESQQIETTWNGVIKAEDHTQANTRLSTYEKNVDTSKYGDDTEYNVTGLEAQVNEHSKPVHDDDKTESWQAGASPVPVRSYYEMNRSQQAAAPIVTIEEVEITDPKDYSVLS